MHELSSSVLDRKTKIQNVGLVVTVIRLAESST